MTRPEYSDDGSTELALPLDLDPSLSTSRRLCAWCDRPIPARARRDAIYCATRCRQASHRFGRGMIRAELTDRPISVAYADPPYPGKASIYREHPDYAGEVDHAELVDRLVSGWPDGWALSTSAEALPQILRLCPDDVRVAAWLRGPRINTRALRPLASWEPVIYRGGRLKTSETPRTDSLVAAPKARLTDPGRVTGAKPAAFVWWLFELLGLEPHDELADLYPGSGGVTRAFDRFRRVAIENGSST